MAEKADILIIGGGVIGWSIAYWLKRLQSNLTIVVVDRHESMAQGATGRAAGGVRAQFATEVNIRLSQFSINFFERFESHTGVDPSFHQEGYLFVTATEQGANYLSKTRKIQNALGVDVIELSPEDITRRAPYLNTNDLIAGSFAAKDGYLDPYSVCRGFENTARKNGTIAKYGTEVIGAQTNNVILQNTKGQVDELTAAQIVLCPGHWADTTASLFDIELPIKKEKHQLAITERLDQLPHKIPMIVDLDTSFHFRREGAGILIGFNDPASAQSEDLNFDFGFLERLAPVAMHRLPSITTTGFDTKKSWTGYYAETPDHHAIIGKVNGIVVACGFGGHGIMHSPAAGIAAAEMILHGESSQLDIHALRPERFAENDLIQESMVI